MSAVVSTENLTTAECRSVAVARNKIARSLAGRLRLIYELASGVTAVTGETARSGTNPDGKVGANRRGFPWGPAFQHPLWIGEGCITTSSLVGERPWAVMSSSSDPRSWDLVIAVPQFTERRLTPYSRAYFSCRVAAASASSTSCDVTLIANGRTQTAAVTLAVTADTTVSPSVWAELRPGLNNVQLIIGPASGVDLTFCSASINQIVERTH
jgi:hypothetical protein